MRAPAHDQIVTVSQLNRMARQLLEQDLPALWVSGEISNLARPASGHIYFSLKDERAQVRCAMFRNANRLLGFRPENGQQVLLHGRVSLYEARGDYQLIAEHLEPAGEGLLRRQFEELKRRLAAEGLFDPARKRAPPGLPRRIGVISSPTGAAIRDILHVLARRFPAVPVILYPVPVQGTQARHEIAAALATAGRRQECDVLILARGGGSLEDLWAFNEEIVARAIADSPIPVIAGIGHEVDLTIADLVADVRAPTPSGAAELAVPDQRDWSQRLSALERQASRCLRRVLEVHALHTRQLGARLARSHPGFVLRQHAQRLDDARQRLVLGLRARLRSERLRLVEARGHLRAATPSAALSDYRERALASGLRLQNAARVSLRRAETRLAVSAGRLSAVSPLRTLERGYAVVTDEAGRVLRRARDVSPGQQITARLAEGQLEATVTRREN